MVLQIKIAKVQANTCSFFFFGYLRVKLDFVSMSFLFKIEKRNGKRIIKYYTQILQNHKNNPSCARKINRLSILKIGNVFLGNYISEFNYR